MTIIPSSRWFPSSIAERAVWYQNFAAQFAAVGTSLGFTAVEIGGVEKDNDVYQFVADIFDQIKAFESAVRQYRIIITEEPIGQPTPQFPANPAFTLPVAIDTGMFDRLNKLVDRIRAAPAYTDEIGALLGILPKQPENITPEELKPVIKVSDSFANYKFTLNVTRMGQESFKVQIRRSNSETWTDAGFGTSSPMDVTVTPTTPAEPERIQVRVILMSKNQPVGQPSDAVYVTVNP